MVIVSAICHSCGISESAFNRRDAFEKHVKLHDKKTPSVCESCGKSYPNLLALNEHVRKYHTKEFVCSQCDKIFHTNYHLKRHMLIHNTDNFSCDVCSTTFSRLDTLNRHKMEVCNGEIAEFKCHICYKVFSRESLLRNHISAKHETLNIVTCEICTKVFGFYFQYMKHKIKFWFLFSVYEA